MAAMRPSRQPMENGMIDQTGSVPVPDPTKLTTDAVDRLEKTLKEVIGQRIDALKDSIDARLNENEKAVVLLRASTDKTPSLIKEEVGGLKSLHQEKFDSIATQFRERDTRTEQTAKDSKVAIDAALQAQEKSAIAQFTGIQTSITKSELNFTKLIDGIDGKIVALNKSNDDKIGDLRDRIQAIESHGKGIGDSWGWLVGGIGMVGALVAIFVSVMAMINAGKDTTTASPEIVIQKSDGTLVRP